MIHVSMTQMIAHWRARTLKLLKTASPPAAFTPNAPFVTIDVLTHIERQIALSREGRLTPVEALDRIMTYLEEPTLKALVDGEALDALLEREALHGRTGLPEGVVECARPDGLRSRGSRDESGDGPEVAHYRRHLRLINAERRENV